METFQYSIEEAPIRIATHALLFNGKGEVLTLQTQKGLWLLPGGRMDPTEKPAEIVRTHDDGAVSVWSGNLMAPNVIEAVLRREFGEELGLDPEKIYQRPYFPIGTAESLRWIGRTQSILDFNLAFYLGGSSHLDINLPPGSEMKGFYWLDIFNPKLPSLAMPANVLSVLARFKAILQGKVEPGLDFFDANRSNFRISYENVPELPDYLRI